MQIGMSCFQMKKHDATIALLDAADAGQQEGDSKSEVDLKEFNFNKLKRPEMKLSCQYCIEHNRSYTFPLSLIFLETATPPPRV